MANMVGLVYIRWQKRVKFFIEESGPEFSAFGRGKYVVNFHGSCQKNNDLLNRLAEQKEYRVGLIESSAGRLSEDKSFSTFS